uniref:VLIG-type G domain-containing protein n=1 Tax=Sphaeramia orbicularis TaxID=375764 RepID=A0A672ZPX2_9TELE
MNVKLYLNYLTSAEFLKIGLSVKQDSNDTTEKDLAHTFLHRLMMLDYRVRYIPVREDSTEMINSCFGSEFLSETADDDFDEFCNATVNFDQSKQNNIHPLDVQMAVFHCSDSFLKQNMITKLSQCQYALPLLVPDPFTMDIECPLWTFRQIKKTWKKTETKDNAEVVTMNSMPICKAETPMVSFFRLGSLSVSKSQLMNTLINDRHNTFFHRDCPGSTKSRHLFDGVAEIAWYCPAGKPNDAFNDCVAFCNLHGDALMNETQRIILMQKCSVNVVLVPTLDKKHESFAVIAGLLKFPKPLICLIDDSCDAVQKLKANYKMGLKDRGLPAICEELKRIIRNILSGPHESFQLETMANVSGIRVDEDDELCQKGKSAAMKILTLVQGVDVSKIKDTFLPCQGKLWHDWCKINKGLYHLKGDRLEEEECKKKRELEKIRGNQCTVSCSEVVKSFTESLSSLPPTEREYFLKWTQILVDVLSTDDLLSIRQNYHEKWSEVLSLKKKHDKSDQLQTKQTELERISSKLQSATFGLEHIFREMGQIYEAHECLHKPTLNKPTDWSKYPELAADLMISGYPMELMDGDAGHVPLTWISSLLDEVIKKLGDQRIFVLSVLGVQSSGKSTMLNAMFGLQFAVSAGRCTRGAFMQLVQVSDEKKRDFQFDYVLVVDTEGLRALELEGNSTLHHDNELATFVVGVGNMTLINIFGENPAEMQDVLQIVVQAFMRMKKVKLSPSCVFVHQNVTDVAAVEKNMDGKRRLQEKLDEMARLAAKEEVCQAQNFSDVIAFDVQKDVKYLAQLWEGSPPMAPPNPGYSESIQDLKSLILSKASQSVGVTLSEFKTKVQDLWNALMNENFVFSFKNTLEIVVYRKLEVQYGNWIWELRREMLTIENQLYNRIENEKHDRIELSYLSKEMSKKYEEVKTTMTSYFEEDKDKEMLAQWRGQFENKIIEFHDKQVRRLKRKLNGIIQQKVACKKLDEKIFENELLQKSKELALWLKDKVNDEEELKHQFNCVWKDWVSELTKDIKPIENIDLENDQLLVLVELDNRHWQNLENEGENNYFERFKDFTETVKTKINDHRKSLQHEDQTLFRNFTDEITTLSFHSITSKPVATRGYSPTFLQEVAKTVQDKVTEFDSQWRYVLKKEFTVDLLLYVFDRAEPWLLESHKMFKMNNDAHTYLESKKGEYYNVFRSFCQGNSSAVVLGELICEKLKGSIVEAVCTKTAIDLAGEMRCSFPAFNGNRLNLEKHVLKSLAEKENFKDYITYVYQPRRHVKSFIKNEANKYIYIDHREKAQNILKKNVDDIKNETSQALFVATEEVKTQQGDLEMWLQKFFSLLKDVLAFSSIYSENFTDVNDFDFLKKGIEERLIPVFKDTKRLSLDKMKEFRKQPDQILIKQLCDCCWETCPFCTAVCTNTAKDHSPNKHSVPFHRPSGINGWHITDTGELIIDFCTTKVASDLSFHPQHESEKTIPYKQYQKAGGKYATWLITPGGSQLTYWKWVICRFQKELEDFHNLKFAGKGEIPSDWRKYKKEEAIQSLDETYR